MYDKVKNTKKTGMIGEEVAASYLMMHGFRIVARNYAKKWGEIDIIAQKNELIHFVEVKAVSYETKGELERAVAHETWRPEELVHSFKLRQISRVLESWIGENTYDGEWVIDVAAVRLVPRETFATVNFIENVVAG